MVIGGISARKMHHSFMILPRCITTISIYQRDYDCARSITHFAFYKSFETYLLVLVRTQFKERKNKIIRSFMNHA